MGVFECDAILVDSTTVVVRTWHEWAEKHDGRPRRRAHTGDQPWAQGHRNHEPRRPELGAGSEAKGYERIEVEGLGGVPEIGGARELLASLPPDGWTVVTSGTRLIAEKKLQYVGLPLPDRFVTAEAVDNGKPHPEAYLKGAEALSARPAACVVEDPPSGVRSAKAAGMQAIAVAITYHQENLTEADAVAASLAKIRATHRCASGAEDRPRFEVRVED